MKLNIRFNKITLEGFLSIGKSTVSLDNRGLVLVSGENHSLVDNAESNGSGKSSLFEGISWALTGSTIRGATDVVNIYYGKYRLS